MAGGGAGGPALIKQHPPPALFLKPPPPIRNLLRSKNGLDKGATLEGPVHEGGRSFRRCRGMRFRRHAAVTGASARKRTRDHPAGYRRASSGGTVPDRPVWSREGERADFCGTLNSE